MERNHKKDLGKERLFRRYRKAFRIPENTRYYSPEDFKRAEKRFVKFCFIGKVQACAP